MISALLSLAILVIVSTTASARPIAPGHTTLRLHPVNAEKFNPKSKIQNPKFASSFILHPSHIALRGPFDEARVLVEGHLRGGGTQDVSAEAVMSIADGRVASVDADGTIQPRADGSTFLIVHLKQAVVRAPVVVRGMAQAGPPRFVTDVIPVMTRAGCNQGACHGAAAGKGGFKLSLFGYDPQADYEAITRTAGARRIARAQPDNSLILRKPTLGVPHRGGKRFAVGSPPYRLLRAWIAAGAPGPAATEPRVTRLEVFPEVRTLAQGQSQHFIVQARYSDGTQRDVTHQTLFNASDETVATVSPDGEAKVVGPGEGAVVIRYQGMVAIARLISPYGPPKTEGEKGRRGEGELAGQSKIENRKSKIDELVGEKLDALGLESSGICTDTDFLRRTYLDVIGLLPAPDQVRAFLADRDQNKRTKLIDALLERPEYVDYWTHRWGDILRDSRQDLPAKGMYAFNLWIRRNVAENRPWDQFTRELLLAQGSAYEDGAVNFYRAVGTPQELAETTSQVFLGVRIQCARCHNHPYAKWKQVQYYQMAAFFARMASKRGERPEERIVFATDSGEVKHPKTQQVVMPCALDSAPLPQDYHGDRRAALVEWITSPQNPFFAHEIVNRIWKHFMGRGFVEPVDDLRVTNPPSNAELFDWLSQDFVKHGYDLKYLMRSILLSKTYQRSPEPTPHNARDTHFYSHYPFKRLEAEQLLDAITAATSVPEPFEGFPTGMHASQLPDTSVPSYFLDLFGRPARMTTCECERSDDPNLGQVLNLMNDPEINSRLTAKNGRVASLLATKLPDRRIVEEIYLASVSRFPTPAESRNGIHVLATDKSREQGAQDLLWALLNSKEFIFNH